MGKCTIDHAHGDVVKKLQSQESFIPAYLAEGIADFLKGKHSQETLNELFHLLKKYDLASIAEQADRNKQLEFIVN